MKINRISSLLISLSLTLPSAVWAQTTKTPIEKPAKIWNTESQSIYDLLVAQLKNSEADYAGSVDTLIKYAKKQKDEKLLSKAYLSLLQTERYSDALALITFWKKNTKQDISKFQVLAQVLNGQFEQAIEVIKKSLDKLPSEEMRQFVIGDYVKMVLTYWYRPEVTTFLKKLYEENPNNKRLALVLAKQLRWHGDTTAANTLFNQLNFDNPKSLTLLKEQSDLFRYSGFTKEANRVWDNAIKDYPKDTHIQFARAQFLYDRYQFSEALEALENIGRSDSKLSTAIATLKMMAAVQLGDSKTAVSAFDWDNLSAEEKNLAHFNYGNELLKKKQFKPSSQQFEQVDKNSEIALSAELKQAQIIYQDDLIEGDAYFEKIIEDYQLDKADAIREQAALLKEVGHGKVAFERLSNYLKIYPENEDVRYSRALLAVELSLNSQAVEDLSIIHTQSPENTDIQNALGYTLLENDDPKTVNEAVGLIKKSLFLQPTSPAIVDSMGWALYQQGKAAEALPFLRYAYGKYQEPEIVGHLIVALVKAGKIAQARELYQLEMKFPANVDKIKRYTQSVKKELN